jgi:hypothetical protein
MHRPPHALQVCGASLVVWRSGRYANTPIGYYNSNSTGEYSYTLIAHGLQSNVGLWRHPSCLEQGGGSWCHGMHGGTRAAPSREVGAGTTGHVATPELPQAETRELTPRDTWRHLNRLKLGAGAGATKRMAAPELPRAERRSPMPWGMWPCASTHLALLKDYTRGTRSIRYRH